MLGYPDSNQERQDQNLQCYHYTIAQYNCSKAVQRYCFFVYRKLFGTFFVNVQSENGPVYYFCRLRTKNKVI